MKIYEPEQEIYVLVKHDVMQKFEHEIRVVGVYDDYEKCYDQFKTLIENYGVEDDMFDNNFEEGDNSVELHYLDAECDFDNYTEIWIETRRLND